MGVKESVQADCEEWKENQWDSLQGKQGGFGRCRVLRNRRTGAMADEYQLSWSNEDQYRFYLKSFNWRQRRKCPQQIVSSLYLQQLAKSEMCSGRWAATVYLQHIPLRLGHLEDLPLSDALLVLGEALEGYSGLFRHSGYFKVQEEQICFDRTGRIKVWVNSDLSRNYPDCDAECGHFKRDQIDMVRQLVTMVSSATDPQQMPQPSLQQYFELVRRRESVQIGFQYARIVVMEFSRLHHINIPARFDAVIDLFAVVPVDQTVKTHPTSTLPSSLVLPPPHQNRLQSYQSLPTLYHMPTMAQQPISMIRPQSTPPIPLLATIPRLQELQSGQFGETSVQTKRKSRNSKTSKNSKSQMVQLQGTTQNQSVHFNESHADERNTMKSMPLHNPFSTHRERSPPSQRPRYSQCRQDAFSHDQSPRRGYYPHNDAFGLSHPRRAMQQSTSSYPLASSSSSHSHLNIPRSRHSGSSRRDSNKHRQQDEYRDSPQQLYRSKTYGNYREMLQQDYRDRPYGDYKDRNYGDYRQKPYSQYKQRACQDWQWERQAKWREQMRRQCKKQVYEPYFKYNPGISDEFELDPQIQADIRKYFG